MKAEIKYVCVLLHQFTVISYGNCCILNSFSDPVCDAVKCKISSEKVDAFAKDKMTQEHYVINEYRHIFRTWSPGNMYDTNQRKYPVSYAITRT